MISSLTHQRWYPALELSSISFTPNHSLLKETTVKRSAAAFLNWRVLNFIKLFFMVVYSARNVVEFEQTRTRKRKLWVGLRNDDTFWTVSTSSLDSGELIPVCGCTSSFCSQKGLCSMDFCPVQCVLGTPILFGIKYNVISISDLDAKGY
jgi:hypothetical protein